MRARGCEMMKVSVPSSSAGRVNFDQLVADNDEASGPAGGAQRGNGAGDATTGT